MMRVKLESGLVPQKMVAWMGQGGLGPGHPETIFSNGSDQVRKQTNKGKAYKGKQELNSQKTKS